MTLEELNKVHELLKECNKEFFMLIYFDTSSDTTTHLTLKRNSVISRVSFHGDYLCDNLWKIVRHDFIGIDKGPAMVYEIYIRTLIDVVERLIRNKEEYMGQHKTNPNSILKAEGKLKPVQRITAAERREMFNQAMMSSLIKVLNRRRTK